MRFLIAITSVLIIYLIYGFTLSQKNLFVVPEELRSTHPEVFYDYKGVSNVQTVFSNGSGTPQEVIKEAQSVGLDFLILTDRGANDAPSVSGYHDNLLVFQESEHRFLDSRLLHVHSSAKSTSLDSRESTVQVTDLLSQKWSSKADSLVILAHPFNGSATWTGEYPTNLDGIEILNPKSISKRAWEKSKLSVLWSFLCYPFNPRFAFLRLFVEPLEETSLWDSLSHQRTFWGYSGVDANAKAIPWTNAILKFPSYAMSFQVSNMHVLLKTELTGHYEKDRQRIFSALKEGQFYSSLDLLGDPKGFFAYLKDHDEIFPIGSRIKFKKNLQIYSRLPIEPKAFYEIVLYKNGDREVTTNTSELRYDVASPGVYRIAVRVSVPLPFPDGNKWVSWIYTNPFYID